MLIFATRGAVAKFIPRCVGEVNPEPDLDLVAPHGGEDHGGVEEVLRRDLRVVPLVERRLERQELAPDLGGNSIEFQQTIQRDFQQSD